MTLAWTEERIDELRRRWDAGESVSAIGEALNVSRGSVTGKADRLGLASRGSPILKRVQEGRAIRERLLAILSACADRGEPCPSNVTLALRLGLADGGSAARALGDLVRAGSIAVQRAGAVRVVTIAATGRATARPARLRDDPRPAPAVPVRRINRSTDQFAAARARAAAHMAEQERRATSQVERAKAHLQRTGRIVYAATVRGGKPGTWIVSGCAHPIGGDALVALAASRGFEPQQITGAAA